MKRRLTIISVLFAFAASVLLAQNGGVVEGTVVDSATEAGISGVSVYFGTDDGTHYETATGDSGAFRIEGMKPGKYGSHYEKAGYLPYYSGQDPAASPMQVAPGGNPHPIRIRLSAPAKLSGRVLDPDGKPANARVDLDLPGKGAITDKQGRFTITGLVPGNRTLLATPIKSDEATPARVSQGVRTELVPTWFPSAIERDQAQEIALASGAAVSDIEIRLQRTPVYRVRGVVLNAAGKPEPHTSVTMASARGRDTMTGLVVRGEFGFFLLGIPTLSAEPAATAATTADGGFEFASVPPGEWQFTAVREAPDESEGAFDSAVASIFVEHDIDNLQIRYAVPFQWKGSVEWLDAPATSHVPQVIVLLAAEDHWAMMGGTQPDGTLRFDKVVPGQYRIMPAPGAPGNYYLASVLVGEREVWGQPVTLFAGSPPLRVVYKPNAGTVRGIVEHCAAVVLVPEHALTALAQDFGRVSSCGAQGDFSIAGVRPDDYYIWALDTADPKKISDPKTLQKLIPKAVRVTVGEGGTASVNLNVTHVPVS